MIIGCCLFEKKLTWSMRMAEINFKNKPEALKILTSRVDLDETQIGRNLVTN
jgi:hypothetical protein